jgi:uncharacterized membrane protein
MKWITSLVKRLPASQRWLLLLGVFLVFFFLAAVPPFQKADEDQHFFRTISVARGTFVCPVVDGKLEPSIPQSYAQLPEQAYLSLLAFNNQAKFSWRGFLTNTTHYSEKFKTDTSRSCVLPFLPYVPTAAVLALPVFLNTNAVFVFYLGRLVQSVVGILLWLWAIHSIPKKYRFIPIFMLLIPMVAHQLSSYSKDMLHLSLGMMAFAYWVKLLETKLKSNKSIALFKKEFLYLLLSLIGIILTRPQYLPLLFVALAIVPFSSKNKQLVRWLLAMFVTSFGATLVLLWSSIRFFHLYSVDGSLLRSSISAMQGIDPAFQIKYLVQYPLKMFVVAYQTLHDNGWFYFTSMVGNLGWLDNQIYFILIGGVAGGFVALTYKVAQLKKKFAFWQLFLLTTALTITIGSIFFSFYLYGSSVASPTVQGVQGRYVLVVMPFVILLVSQLYRIKKQFFIGIFSLLLVGGVGLSTFSRYYNFKDHYYQQAAKILDFSTVAPTVSHFKLETIAGRKLRGLILYRKAEVLSDSTYTISIKDESCQTLLTTQVVAFSEWKNNKVTVLMPPITMSDSVICLEVAVFGKQQQSPQDVLGFRREDELPIVDLLYLY